jgi:hypothetical protein
LKSAIFEEPFQPKLAAASELVRGIGAGEYPILQGYVCTTAKSRAETPLVSDKGDPILAHWQYGLGRAVAFTSDARAKWARNWLGWDKYRQFWSQTAQWSLRRVENADLTADVSVEKGEGRINVEAVDDKGDYRNFLNLETVVVSPKGERQTIRLEQMGPGRYEARFPTREVGSYLLNVMELKGGKVAGSQAVGTSVNYSPEFNAPEPNTHLLKHLAEIGGGRLLNPLNVAENPFLHDRKKTFQPQELWEWLLEFSIVLFTVDVGVRRIQIEREEWLRATQSLRRWLFFWQGKPRPVEADESLAALLARRGEVRARQTAPAEARPELFQPVSAPKPIEDRPGPERASATGIAPPWVAPKGEPGRETEEKPAATTSRLLEAKRRARKKMD